MIDWCVLGLLATCIYKESSCLLVLVHQVNCLESSNCYSDVNVCFWTDGSALTQYEAQAACRQRRDSFLPRISNRNIQSALADFLSWTKLWYLPDYGNFWIDARAAVAINDSFHWINGPPFAGLSSMCCFVHCCMKLYTCSRSIGPWA